MSIVIDLEMFLAEKYDEKYDYISSILLRVKKEDTCSEYIDWFRTWSNKYSMPVLIKRVICKVMLQ